MTHHLQAASLATLVLLSGALLAAEPPANTAEPAVVTSPAAASPARPATDTVVPATAPAAATPAGTPPAPAAATTVAGAAPTGNRGNSDRIELGATQITGNAELPRVMYVVPWKRPELGDIAGRPAKSLLDEVLTPIDRDVFRRQNRYYEALQPDAAAATPEGEK